MTRQLNLLDGAWRKKHGLDRVEEKAEDWITWIRRKAHMWAQIHGEVSADNLRHFADSYDRHPHHPNAWGAIFRGRQWEVVGYRKSTYRTNNARRICVWRLTNQSERGKS